MNLLFPRDLNPQKEAAPEVPARQPTKRTFRFTIRELCLLITILALMLGWAVDRYRIEKQYHDEAIRPFAEELRNALSSATSIEIGDRGPQMHVRSEVIEG